MQAITQARRQVSACEQGIIEANRQAFLQAHHPELVAQRETLRRDNPANILDAMAPDFNIRQARWRAQVAELEGQLTSVLEAAGV